MGSISSGQYSARARVDKFKGLFQDTDINVDMAYAREAANLDFTGGGLRTVSRSIPHGEAQAAPIETLMRLHRRFQEEDRDILVAASGGQLYWMLGGGDVWTKIPMPEGTGAYQLNVWSWATYEINPEGSEAPVDVLLLSNGKDGMIMVRGDDMTAARVETPKKFGVISRYAERIWGGAIESDPDMLVYSAPFDPTDWSANTQFPEDGAGDIAQPSWDGDSFTAITQFGSRLIAMKKYRVWSILGTNPGEFVFKEQYGGGAVYSGTVATEGERILMLGKDGLLEYDGLSVHPYYPQFARNVFERMNRGALDGARACVYKHAYYCALPLDGATQNNAILIFDTIEGAWSLREGVTVKDFLPADSGLYFTSAEQPRRVYRLWEGWGGEALPARWVSHWQDHGRADVRKGGFSVYMTVLAEKATEILITMQTEKKQKTKVLRVRPPSSASKGPMQRRVQFGGAGRRWRISLESLKSVPWRLVGGIQIDVETDPD